MRVLLGFVVAALLTVGCSKSGDSSSVGFAPSADDSRAIRGSWTIVKVTSAGQERPLNDEMRATYLEVTADEWNLHGPNNQLKKATYTIDPTKSPKQIDCKPTNGTTLHYKGIYELSGDTLKACFNNGNDRAPRPDSFNSKERGIDWQEHDIDVTTLKRK